MNLVYSKFINICKFGNISNLEQLIPFIDVSEFVTKSYYDYPNAIFIAVKYRQLEIVKYFINEGFNIQLTNIHFVCLHQYFILIYQLNSYTRLFPLTHFIFVLKKILLLLFRFSTYPKNG